MEQQQTNGFKKTKILPIRIDRNQFERLQALASAEGYTSLSQYIRSKILEPSVENKLNRILDILSTEKTKLKEKSK